MPRLKGSADLLEDRRRRALALWDTGLSLNEVGRRIPCAPSSVLRWLRARRRGGPDALRVRFSPGRPLKLSTSQRRRLVKLLLQGPQAHGYRTQLWTTARIAEVIRREFGSALPSRSCGAADASPEVEPPETRNARRRARRRGHRALEAEGLASGKKNARRLGAHLVFADESGFLLAPLVVKTWAPQGCTPVLRHRQGRRDKISVISGISVSPQRQHLGPVLSALLRQHRPRRGGPVSPRAPATPPGSRHRPAGQFLHAPR